MTEKPATAMLSLDPQPVYLIAGQTAAEQPGLSLMDVLVWAYHRRWWLVVWFVVLMLVQVGVMPSAKQEQCLFTIRTERGSLDGLVVALQEGIARRGDSVREFSPQIDFQKLGTAAKAEQTRSLVLVQVTASANEPAPSLLEDLRQLAQTTAARTDAEYQKQAALGVQVANERLQSLRGDSNATVAERSGAEMSLASAKVALQTPPVVTISEIQRNAVATGYAKRLALTALLSGIGSLLLVGAGWGYRQVQRRATQA